jgi:hypothetical protein
MGIKRVVDILLQSYIIKIGSVRRTLMSISEDETMLITSLKEDIKT